MVGIAKDVPLQSRAEPPDPYVYVAYWQNPEEIDARYCVRVRGDPEAMLPSLVREVNRVDPEVPVTETITLPVQLEGQLRWLRVGATFLAYAAALAMLLSAIGLYGVLAFSVQRRTKEIGIRIAVGGRSGQVLRMIVAEGMTVIGVGAVLGLVIAVSGTHLIGHFLYGSPDRDAVFYGSATLSIIAVGLIAAFLPAFRAARIEPLIALRED